MDFSIEHLWRMVMEHPWKPQILYSEKLAEKLRATLTEARTARLQGRIQEALRLEKCINDIYWASSKQDNYKVKDFIEEIEGEAF